MIIIALIAFAVATYLFILFTVKKDHGHKEPLGALFAAMGFGLVAVVLAGFLNEWLIPKQVLDSVSTGSHAKVPAGTLLAATIGVGVIEESLKALPLAFFIYKKRYFDEMTDGIIYFGIAALTFGILEDVSYSLQFGGGVGLMRILMSPYLHVGFSILIGTSLIYKKLFKASWLVVAVGFMLAVLAHGLYDFSSLSGGAGIIGSLFITVALNILVFVLFHKTQKIDEKQGRSAIGINKFCRHCGRPNRKRLLYCSYCGKYT